MAFNKPWCTAAQAAADFRVHFVGESGFTDATPLPTLSATLTTQIEDIRDVYAQPEIMRYLSPVEIGLLTHVHHFLTHPVLGADGSTVSYALPFTATAGTVYLYESLSGPWRYRSRYLMEETGWTLTGNAVVFDTAPTKGTLIVVEYDHTFSYSTAPKDLNRWARFLTGWHYITNCVYIGNDPNDLPAPLVSKYQSIMTELQNIRDSKADVSIAEFRVLNFYESTDDDRRASRTMEVLRA